MPLKLTGAIIQIYKIILILDQPKKPRNFIPDFMMDEDALFVHMEDKMSDQYSEDPTEVSTDVKKLPFVQNLIRESKANITILYI